MIVKTMRFSIILSVVILIALLQTACSSQVTIEPTITITPTETPVPITTQIKTFRPTNTLGPTKISIPTSTEVFFVKSTPTPTLDFTQQAWHAAAIAVHETERAVISQARSDKATQIAQFPSVCEDLNRYRSDISPNGKWFAASCGYTENQTLIVQNKEGTKWVLEFKDFLNPDTPVDIIGSLDPIYWSPEGEYLYFTTILGYDGGGTQCFTWSGGNYGLLRLNLKTGSWVTLVPPTDYFPGYIIKFSPTGRRYAIDLNGVMITDLQTGKITQIDITGLTDFIWSPDGKYLAYSVASCGEMLVQSSSVYVWNILTNQKQKLLTVDDILLLPELWIDNSTLRIIGEKIIDFDMFYTIYEYNIIQKSLVFTGTATPSP